MGCTDCEEKKTAQPAEPVRWISARIWWDDGGTLCFGDVLSQGAWKSLPDAILGAIGVRSDGTTDFVSGYDWYGWFPFPDGWRISGHHGDKAENDRQRKRYPDAVWKEGILVSDNEMKKVEDEMRAYQESVR